MSEPMYGRTDFGEGSRTEIEEWVGRYAAELVYEIDATKPGLTDEEMIEELEQRQRVADECDYDGSPDIDYYASAHALWMLRRALSYVETYPLDTLGR